MAEREKVIKGLEWILNDIEENGHYQINYYAEEIRKAIALLKEQEAKPVKITKNAYNHKFYYCPNCGRGFEDTYYKRPLYCDKCGQAVKWE